VLLTLFAFTARSLAAVGLYGPLSYIDEPATAKA
jgi:hypothetical protein